MDEGFYNFINWFDEISWYPLGRIVGGTVYPGLMVTAAFVYQVLHFLNFTVDIRNVCVLLAPWFASNTAMVTYLFAKEVSGSKGSGLAAAAMIAIVPGYISRSVAGSFDNEGIAIFALILTFYLWVKSVNTGIELLFLYSSFRIIVLVRTLCYLILLHGICLGWICIYYQSYPNPCFVSIIHRTTFKSVIYCLLNSLYYGNSSFYAN